jgi:hypothetical protein
MNELALALLIWITEQTGYALPAPAAIVVVSRARMSELAYRRAAEPADDVPAAYDSSRKVVYLRDDWKLGDLRSHARLLHELVHHVQNFNRVPYPCPAAAEPEAYSLALNWLEEQGAADPYEVLEIDAVTIWMLSRCPEG